MAKDLTVLALDRALAALLVLGWCKPKILAGVVVFQDGNGKSFPRRNHAIVTGQLIKVIGGHLDDNAAKVVATMVGGSINVKPCSNACQCCNNVFRKSAPHSPPVTD